MELGLRAVGASERARPFWILVGVRVAFWVGAALALIWAPLPRARVSPFDAHLPHLDLLFGTFAKWDATWFVHIAEHGYDSEQAAAFFPLYPAVVAAVAVVTRSTLIAGVLVSLVAAGIAAVLVWRVGRAVIGERAARDAVLYVALYPLAFVFTSVYSDALFLALAAGAFLAGLRRRAVLAGVLGALAVATRSMGLALLPPLLLLLWPRDRSRRELAQPLPLLLLPAALGAFALHLHDRLGNATAFVDAQESFWQRRTPTLGPLGGLWEAAKSAYHGAAQLLLHLPSAGERFDRFDQLALWYVLHFLLLLAALALTWVAWRRLGPAYGLYSASVLVVALSTISTWFPLQSFPRFVLADFPLFLALAALTETRPRARTILLCAFAAIGAVAAVAFSRGTWVA